MHTESDEFCLKLLPSDGYVEFIRTSQDGVSGYTHMASVDWGNGANDSWVKIYKKDAPRCLINEVVGYLLAKSLGLPQPKCAGLMAIPVENIPVHVADQLNDIDLYRGHTYAWITTHAGENKRELITNNSAALEKFLFEMANWSNIEHMIAFDHWIVNNDRQIGNLLQLPDNTFTLIDHGDSCGGKTWDGDTFLLGKLRAEIKYVHQMFKRHKVIDMFTPVSILQDLIAAKKKHKDAFTRAKPELAYWLENMLGDETVRSPIKGVESLRMIDILLSFLEHRSTSTQAFEKPCAALLNIFDDKTSQERPS